jgi:hypothetical protein
MADTITKRYFAQVGSELIEIDPDHVDLHHDGATFSTSAPVRFYRIRAVVNDNATFSGDGATWTEAEADLDKQIPKVAP